MTTIDTNVDNYSVDELMQIIGETEFDEDTVSKKTNSLIKQFQNSNPNLSNFFREIQIKLEHYISELDKKTPFTDKKTNEWYENQVLPQDIENQKDKITDRKNKIDIYNNQHVPMNRQQLGINNNFNVDVAQDTLNPNLKNTYTRFVNIDSQFRQYTGNNDACDFSLDLSDSLVNALSIRLYSFQIPFTWYIIDATYGNSFFWITNDNLNVPIVIPSGNYKPSELVDALNEAFKSASFTFPTTVPINTPVTYNSITGKIKMNLFGGAFAGGTINGITYPGFSITESTILTFFDYTSNLRNELLTSAVNTNNYLNQTLGWIMGYRMPLMNVNIKGNEAPAVLDLNGTKYLILVVDDYNQNHVNNGLVSITEYSNNLKLPSYYSPDLTYVYVNPDGVSDNLNNLIVEEGQNSQDGLLIAGKMTLDYQPRQIIIPSAPRTLTQSQIYTINQIIKNRNNNTNLRAKAPTNPDILAILPLKPNLTTGTLISDNGGSLQENIRVYFGPVHIERLKIKLLDDKGNVLNLNGNDWCFTLICECLYQY
jgi:hypothetical protein